jgi:hypothetical protein
MNWFVDDYSRTQILITDGVREFYVPKFRIAMDIDGDYVYLYWNDRERGTGGDERLLQLNYLDVVDGYSGYIDNPTSATNLAAQIDAMIESAWTDIGAGGDLLTAKADLLSHDGVSDTILPGGTNEYILSRNNTEQTGLEWISPATVVTNGGGLTSVSVDGVTIQGNGSVGSPVKQKQKVFTIGTIAHNPADATTYYWGGPAWNPVTGAIQDRRKTYLYEAATITHCYIEMLGTTSGATAENISIYIQVNGTTDYLVQTTAFGVGQFVCPFANTAMNISLGATDWFVFKIVCPTWVVNPTQVYYSGKLLYNV